MLNTNGYGYARVHSVLSMPRVTTKKAIVWKAVLEPELTAV